MERTLDEVLAEYHQNDIVMWQGTPSSTPTTAKSNKQGDFIEYVQHELETAAVGSSPERFKYRRWLMKQLGKSSKD